MPRKKQPPRMIGLQDPSSILNVSKSPLFDFKSSPIFNLDTSPLLNLDTSSLLKVGTSPLLDFNRTPLLDITKATTITNDAFPLQQFQELLKLPNIATLDQIQASLAFPTSQIFGLASAALDEFPNADVDGLSSFEDELSSSDSADAPELLSDRLLWLPEIRQRRIFLAAILALKECVSFIDLETGVPAPGHVLQLVSLLWAVAAALSEWIEWENGDAN